MDPNIPQIDENIPIPEVEIFDLPVMSSERELEVRLNTAHFLSKICQKRSVFAPNRVNPILKVHANATLAFLAGAIAQLDGDLVDDPIQLRRYILNKLVMEVENAASPKDRLTALRMMGDLDNVAAFKQRTESVVTVRNITDVEKDLRELIEREKRTITVIPDKPEVPNG